MNTKANIEKIVVDGKTYVEEGLAQPKMSGNRAVIVVDRGWVVAGDVNEDNPARIVLSNAVWLFRWDSIGLDGVIADPKSPKATLRPMPNGFSIPSDSEIFRIPVAINWGMHVYTK